MNTCQQQLLQKEQTMKQHLNVFDTMVGAQLGLIHPALSRRFVQGRRDAERGDVSVSMVMWVSISVLMAAAIGKIIWEKVRDKAKAIDVDTPK
jgi:hypothetical protein